MCPSFSNPLVPCISISMHGYGFEDGGRVS
jgi:hypothetical protein